MSRRFTFVAFAVAVLAVVVYFVANAGDGPRRAKSGAGDEAAAEQRLGPFELAATPDTDTGQASAVSGELAADESESARESLGAAAGDEPPVVRRAVRGQVLDEFGAPSVGEWVQWDQRSDDERNTKGFRANSLPISHAQTDASGWFEFPLEFGDASLGGRLQYGIVLFGGTTPIALVDREGRDHFLQYPTRGADGPELVVEVVDARDGAPLYPETFELALTAWSTEPVDPTLPESVTARGSWRIAPHPATIVRRLGEVRVERLAPGTWRLVARATNSTAVTREFTIPLRGDDVALRVELATFDGDWLVGLGPRVGDLLAPDRGNGFDRFLAAELPRRELAGRDSNGHFVHTISGFDGEEIEGAVLELDLEAVPDMCDNDAIGLEFADGGFAWGIGIGELVGRSWDQGQRALVSLDLARLPVPGGTMSLLDRLADGGLDVYVQDDTAVHALVLHVK
jgi:hypothetical protein